MTQAKDKKPDEAAAAAAKAADPGEEEALPVELLLAQSYAYTGYPTHVLAGALHGVDRKTLTVTEAQEACAAWREASEAA